MAGTECAWKGGERRAESCLAWALVEGAGHKREGPRVTWGSSGGFTQIKASVSVPSLLRCHMGIRSCCTRAWLVQHAQA